MGASLATVKSYRGYKNIRKIFENEGDIEGQRKTFFGP